jgi:CsoR family transcriptional regulator, copper-sensing transcriptional repressor
MSKQCLPLYTDGLKKDTLARLSRIEGQVRGVAKMLEDGRGSLEVLQQLASVQAALRSVSKSILRNHLECCCAAQTNQSDDSDMYDQLMDVIYKFAK